MKSVVLNAFLVGSGGFAGAILRYAVSGALQRCLPLATFPYGTLCVNLLGCLFIGALSGLADSRQLFGPELRAFALIGLLGGFTTFSTFAYESFAMARDGELLRAGANIGIQVVFGLGAAWLAYDLAAAR